jgi:hypothetical protein
MSEKSWSTSVKNALKFLQEKKNWRNTMLLFMKVTSLLINAIFVVLRFHSKAF